MCPPGRCPVSVPVALRLKGAADLDEEAAPARRVGVFDADGAGPGATAAEHPGCEPGLDLRGQVTEEVAAGDVDPDAGCVVQRWIRDEDEVVAGLEALEVVRAVGEDGAVHRGPELVGRRVVCGVKHGDENIGKGSVDGHGRDPRASVGVDESMSGDDIYLDHAATTPVRPEVEEALRRRLGTGNPSSVHGRGREARAVLEEARSRVASALGAERREVVFTSGGTEADNLAVLGRWRAAGGPVVCSAVEHQAVLGPAKAVGRAGSPVLVLGVDGAGRVEEDALDEAIRATPSVVSVMWANNELGTLQPVAELGARCREAGVAFHSDAVQAVGRVPVRVDKTPVDLLSLSAHKLGGPKGVGVLYVRDGIVLEPLAWGGGQERGFRPGTENVAGAVGLAVAVELAVAEREVEALRLGGLRDRLESGLGAAIEGLRVNGGDRVAHILNVTIPGVDREMLLPALDLEGIAASTGSACGSGASRASHVMVATGADGDGVALRLSLGRTTSAEEVDRALEVLPRVVDRLRDRTEVPA